MSFEEKLKKLNKEQREAVESLDGPILVLAGPGSGKTEIISMRVANILKKTDTKSSSILCLTFTDSASLNMRERLLSLIGLEAYKVSIYTFHSFCTDVIDRYSEYFFDNANFKPADDVLRIEVMNHILKNLKYDNPLRSEHSEEGFVFLSSIIGSISDLKRAGINANQFKEIVSKNEKVIEKINKFLPDFIPDRVSKDIKCFEDLLKKIESIKTDTNDNFIQKDILSVIKEDLIKAINQSKEGGLSKPLSEWKKEFIAKSDDGDFILKESVKIEKQKALSLVYEMYEKEMNTRRLFDFDDMILKVIDALENNKSLLYDLQERFEYFLVDEFQDTNGAQMKILSLLTNASVNEGRPNIMVVGDDDQSIYKFQGAEIENMLYFKSVFRNPKIINLNLNYRSAQKVIDISESVINQTSKSIRNILPEISKSIKSSDLSKKGQIVLKEFSIKDEEYEFISNEIKNLLNNGVSPKEIALISRHHKNLMTVSKFLFRNNIHFKYQKKKNILEDDFVDQIITIIYFINSISGSGFEKDYLLPKTMSFPFWQIDRKDIWQLSINAKNNKSGFLTAMEQSDNKKIKDLANFLIELGVYSKSAPFERVLDKIVGSDSISKSFDEDDFVSNSEDKPKSFISPFRDFYFKDRKNPEYFSFFSALKTLVNSLREYKQGKVLRVDDIVFFIDIYKKNNLELLDESFYVNGVDAVSLLTAHKSKGLEFEYVFILSANDSEWVPKNRGSKISMPLNLKVSPTSDSLDDKIRLFYVALTRAKHTLYITRYRFENNDKENTLVPFINHLKEDFSSENIELKQDEFLYEKPYKEDEKSILSNLLENYKMSVTHLNNFLNIESAGPLVFLEQNLLHFPQSKNASSVYGSAIHNTIEYIGLYFKKEGKLPILKNVVDFFRESLEYGRLDKSDFDVYFEKGKDVLSLFLKESKGSFNKKDLFEVDFKNQGVFMNGAYLSGKIDKIIFNEGGDLSVLDFKTGKPLNSLEEKEVSDKVKLLNYKRQLLFYKILVENSRDYSKYKVSKGILSFLEPKAGKFTELSMNIESEDIYKLSKLIEIVYKKIKNLDFPDTTKYSPDYKGCIEFEKDLLEGSI